MVNNYRFFDIKNVISGKMLKERGEEIYIDNRENTIEFFNDIADAITISFWGSGNLIKIGKRVRVEKLNICCGNNGIFSIGQKAKIKSANIYVADGSIVIGNDCLFSSDIVLRNHNAEHMIKKDSLEKNNDAGNIKIGNHVWIGYGVTLLGSAAIGDNSVVGARAVIASSFPKEVIIAGNPAKVIREHVCWSRDVTGWYNWDYLEECTDQAALKYF